MISTINEFFVLYKTCNHQIGRINYIHVYINSIQGIAALGANYISIGIHTGTILLFRVAAVPTPGDPPVKETTAMSAFRCEQVDSQRCHVFPITDLASTSTLSSESKEVSLGCNNIN